MNEAKTNIKKKRPGTTIRVTSAFNLLFFPLVFLEEEVEGVTRLFRENLFQVLCLLLSSPSVGPSRPRSNRWRVALKARRRRHRKTTDAQKVLWFSMRLLLVFRDGLKPSPNEHFQRDRRMDANAQQESIRLTSLWKNLFVGVFSFSLSSRLLALAVGRQGKRKKRRVCPSLRLAGR